MTPENITERLVEISLKIASAAVQAELLVLSLKEAAKDDAVNAVIFDDVRHEASLPKIESDLRGLFDIIDRAIPNVSERLTALKSKRDIRTTYVHPPIPIRTMDWRACVEGTEEDGPYGWGRTEAEAIEDLEMKLEGGE